MVVAAGDESLEAPAKAGDKTTKVRGRSNVVFPYYDLERSEEVARLVHDRGGGACDLSQLAGFLGYSGVSNGGFRSRYSSARMFGLIEGDTKLVRLTERGRMIVAPVDQADVERARVDAFLEVELFRKVFERFNGASLPSQAGLANLLLNDFRVIKDRVAPTIRILMDSAELAGFFTVTGNRSRLVRPVANGHANGQSSSPPTSRGDDGGREDRPAAPAPAPVSPPANSPPAEIHPAIYGLLRELPATGMALSDTRRKALIQAFTSMVEFIYPPVDA
jgi:hypothetical protein